MIFITNDFLIAGGGLSGLGAYSVLKEVGSVSVVEKSNELLGHARSHKYQEHFFDEGVHVCHSKNESWLSKLNLTAVNFIEQSDVRNIDKGRWIGYPVQNNLADLPSYERNISFERLKKCSQQQFDAPKNYEDWLKNTYGDFLYNEYYRRFTLKYWRCEPRELGLDWLDGRLLPVRMDLVESGLVKNQTSQAVFSSYYYPASGGFQNLFSDLAAAVPEIDKHLNSEIVNIDLTKKTIETCDGSVFEYERLIYTLPLPLLCSLVTDFPDKLRSKINQLRYTRLFTLGIEVSGVDVESIPDWFYIYDSDIDVSRVFNVSKASGDNSRLILQCETYRRDDESFDAGDIEKAMHDGMQRIFPEAVVSRLLFNITEYSYIVPLDLNAGVVEEVSHYLEGFNVTPVGLYGLWRYRWSDQVYTETQNLIRRRFL